MSNFTRADVDMLRRLFRQQMDLVEFCRGSHVMVSRATRIDELADQVEDELWGAPSGKE